MQSSRVKQQVAKVCRRILCLQRAFQDQARPSVRGEGSPDACVVVEQFWLAVGRHAPEILRPRARELAAVIVNILTNKGRVAG